MATYHLSAKVGRKGMGSAHSNYIERVGKNAKHQDLEHIESGNLPNWSNGKTSTFWKAADSHERENGSVYRELVVALPRELKEDQRLDLVREFIRQEIGDKHAYSFAIHCPKAALDPKKGDQPHAHIMYSERLLDGIDRSEEQYFKRYNAKAPEKGGLKKAIPKDMVEKKSQLKDLRERWATLQNEHLTKHGHSSQVDHRSLEAQGIERDPSKHLPHLGVAAIGIMKKQKVSTRRNAIIERRNELLTINAPAPVKKSEIRISRYDPQHPNYAEFMAQRESRAIATKQLEKPIETIIKVEPVKYTTSPQKSILEHIAESIEVLLRWVKGKGGQIREIQPNSQHTGRIEQLSDYHAVQNLGRGTYAIHELDKLDLKPQINNMATIKYRDGVGKVVIDRVNEFGLGR